MFCGVGKIRKVGDIRSEIGSGEWGYCNFEYRRDVCFGGCSWCFFKIRG